MPKEIPFVSHTKDAVIITIPKDRLIYAIENRSDEDYMVRKPSKLLKALAFQLKDYHTPNGVEIGMTALQELMDTCIDEIYEDGEDIITSKDFDYAD